MRFFVPVLMAAVLCGCRDDAARHLERAKDFSFEKNPNRALQEYAAANELLEREVSPEALVLRARALKGAADIYYLDLRDIPRAIEVYRLLVQQCPEAPESLEARIILADVLRQHFRDLRGAINELTAALERNPPQSAELKYKVAKLYFELGDYRQAELEAVELAGKYENSPYVDDAAFLEGQAISMMEGRPADAAKAFEDVVRRHGSSQLAPYALYELGKLEHESGQNAKAIELWVQALKAHPDPALVQSAIARARRHIENTAPVSMSDRRAIFDKGVRIPPGTLPLPRVRRAVHKTSAEAVGASAEEAAREGD